MRRVGIQYANARVQRGADIKDLWYHLVRGQRSRCLKSDIRASQSDEGGFENEKPPMREVIADGPS